MASAMIAVTEERSTRLTIREVKRHLGILSLALHLVLPAAARAHDVRYPEYKRNPVPPVAVVEDIVVDDEPVAPSCNAANEGCDDPAPASTALASREDDATGVRARHHPVAPSLPKGLKFVPSS